MTVSTSADGTSSSKVAISSNQLPAPTSNATNTQPSTHHPLYVSPKILGGAIAGVVAIVLALSIYTWYRKRRARERNKTAAIPYENPLIYNAAYDEETHPPEYASQADMLDIASGAGASRGTEARLREKS